MLNLIKYNNKGLNRFINLVNSDNDTRKNFIPLFGKLSNLKTEKAISNYIGNPNNSILDFTFLKDNKKTIGFIYLYNSSFTGANTVEINIFIRKKFRGGYYSNFFLKEYLKSVKGPIIEAKIEIANRGSISLFSTLFNEIKCNRKDFRTFWYLSDIQNNKVFKEFIYDKEFVINTLLKDMLTKTILSQADKDSLWHNFHYDTWLYYFDFAINKWRFRHNELNYFNNTFYNLLLTYLPNVNRWIISIIDVFKKELSTYYNFDINDNFELKPQYL